MDHTRRGEDPHALSRRDAELSNRLILKLPTRDGQTDPVALDWLVNDNSNKCAKLNCNRYG